VDDETRFFKYFTSTPGLAFIGKQNALSLTSVRTQASRGPSNQGVYLPTSTAAQLAVNPFGGHLNFLGVDPTGLLGGITKYGDLVNPPLGIGSISKPDGNRLIALQNSLKDKTATSNFNFVKGTTINPLPGVLYNYRGGPGAVEGKGKTNIKRYSFTGLDNPLYTSDKNYFLGKNNNKIHIPDNPDTWGTIPLGATDYYNGTGLADLGQSGIVTPSSFLGSTFTLGNINTSVYKTDYSSGTGSFLDKREDLDTYLVGKKHDGLEELKEKRFDTTKGFYHVTSGVSDAYVRFTPFIGPYDEREGYDVHIIKGDSSPTLRNSTSVYKSGSLTNDTQITEQNITRTYTQEDLSSQDKIQIPGVIRQDFRKILRTRGNGNESSMNPTSITNAPDYLTKNWEQRTNAGDPGVADFSRRSSYTTGRGTALDKINSLPIYQSTAIKFDKAQNDLIKFGITSVDGSGKNSKSVHMHFRAFIDGFSDSYGAQWSGERYPGRGEEFFRYGGFTRGISLSFTSAAQSKQELIPMYKKLNFLASNTMNDYSPSGYMRPPFIKLTVGGYLFEQFGFLKGINYGWEMLTPFEIGINDSGLYDSSVKELPHVIKVTGFDFQPIYDFLPQKQQNGFSDSGELTTYGPERYIALKAGDTNYTNTP
tara:strand:- start:526 stop:2469 length:1944 start_codon:yes stop_codon:yes gene_type:complete